MVLMGQCNHRMALRDSRRCNVFLAPGSPKRAVHKIVRVRQSVALVRLNRLPELPEMRPPRALDTLCAIVRARCPLDHILYIFVLVVSHHWLLVVLLLI